MLGVVTSGRSAELFLELISVRRAALEEQPAELNVLSRCANPKCLNRFLQLGTGRLFLVEAEASPEAQSKDRNHRRSNDPRSKMKQAERYWLCDGCAKTWTLVHNAHAGISLALLRLPPVGVGILGAAAGRTS